MADVQPQVGFEMSLYSLVGAIVVIILLVVLLRILGLW